MVSDLDSTISSSKKMLLILLCAGHPVTVEHMFRDTKQKIHSILTRKSVRSIFAQ